MRRAGEDPLKPGEVAVGGFGSSELAVSYARAARALFDAIQINGGDLAAIAAPIFFLARHAVELSLKEIIHFAYGMRHAKAEIQRHDGKPFDDEPTEAEIDRRLLTHDLGALLDMIRHQDDLAEHVRPSWQDLVDSINKHEKDHPERFRFERVYESTRAKREKRRMVPSFGEREVIPLAELLDKLDQFVAAAVSLAEDAASSVLWHLGLEAEQVISGLRVRGLLPVPDDDDAPSGREP